MNANDKRARNALDAVEEFAQWNLTKGEPLDDNITDLLTDLMHLCDRNRLSFTALTARAFTHHDEERVE